MEYYQALVEEPDTLELLTKVIADFWCSGDTMPALVEKDFPKPRVPPEPPPGKESIKTARRDNWRVQWDQSNPKRGMSAIRYNT